MDGLESVHLSAVGNSLRCRSHEVPWWQHISLEARSRAAVPQPRDDRSASSTAAQPPRLDSQARVGLSALTNVILTAYEQIVAPAEPSDATQVIAS